MVDKLKQITRQIGTSDSHHWLYLQLKLNCLACFLSYFHYKLLVLVRVSCPLPFLLVFALTRQNLFHESAPKETEYTTEGD